MDQAKLIMALKTAIVQANEEFSAKREKKQKEMMATQRQPIGFQFEKAKGGIISTTPKGTEILATKEDCLKCVDEMLTEHFSDAA
ncbi:MAG: hypothetical protein ACPGO7_02745 [Alphaproteobacteria bacterium]